MLLLVTILLVSFVHAEVTVENIVQQTLNLAPQGWTAKIVGRSSGFTLNAQHVPSLGYQGQDDGDLDWYFYAPRSMLNDMSASYQGNLSIVMGHLEFHDNGMDVPTDKFDVIFESTALNCSVGAKGMFIPYSEPPIQEWILPVVNERFVDTRSGQLIGQHAFIKCLSRLSAFRIRGGYYRGRELTVLSQISVRAGPPTTAPQPGSETPLDIHHSCKGEDMVTLYTDYAVSASKFQFTTVPAICGSAILSVTVSGPGLEDSRGWLSIADENGVTLGNLYKTKNYTREIDFVINEYTDSIKISQRDMTRFTSDGIITFTLSSPPPSEVGTAFAFVRASLSYTGGACMLKQQIYSVSDKKLSLNFTMSDLVSPRDSVVLQLMMSGKANSGLFYRSMSFTMVGTSANTTLYNFTCCNEAFAPHQFVIPRSDFEAALGSATSLSFILSMNSDMTEDLAPLQAFASLKLLYPPRQCFIRTFRITPFTIQSQGAGYNDPLAFTQLPTESLANICPQCSQYPDSHMFERNYLILPIPDTPYPAGEITLVMTGVHISSNVSLREVFFYSQMLGDKPAQTLGAFFARQDFVPGAAGGGFSPLCTSKAECTVSHKPERTRPLVDFAVIPPEELIIIDSTKQSASEQTQPHHTSQIILNVPNMVAKVFTLAVSFAPRTLGPYMDWSNVPTWFREELFLSFNGNAITNNYTVLSLQDLQSPPTYSAHLNGAGDELYTLMMIDAFNPCVKAPTCKYWLHWMKINLRSQDLLGGDTLVPYNVPFNVSSTPACISKTSSMHQFEVRLYQQSFPLLSVAAPARYGFDPDWWGSRQGIGDGLKLTVTLNATVPVI